MRVELKDSQEIFPHSPLFVDCFINMMSAAKVILRQE